MFTMKSLREIPMTFGPFKEIVQIAVTSSQTSSDKTLSTNFQDILPSSLRELTLCCGTDAAKKIRTNKIYKIPSIDTRGNEPKRTQMLILRLEHLPYAPRWTGFIPAVSMNLLAAFLTLLEASKSSVAKMPPKVLLTQFQRKGFVSLYEKGFGWSGWQLLAHFCQSRRVVS